MLQPRTHVRHCTVAFARTAAHAQRLGCLPASSECFTAPVSSAVTPLVSVAGWPMRCSVDRRYSTSRLSSSAMVSTPDKVPFGAAPNRQRRALSTTYSAQRSLADLPDKVTVRSGPLGRLSKVLTPRESPTITTRVGSSFGGNHSLEWCEKPRNILLIKKRNDDRSTEALYDVMRHIRDQYPWMNLIIEKGRSGDEKQSRDQFDVVQINAVEDKNLLASKVDLVVTLGGDGTILHVSSLFDQAAVPPVLSFSMGTLGFLLPFHIDDFRKAFADVVQSRSSLLLRMRLHQTSHNPDGSIIVRPDGGDSDVHLMNEVALHRASSPHMTMIDAYVDGRHLTQAISDGLIIATPTGSTAYSLSAGGPIVHPSVQSLVLTPICPRSLSFRTVLLPSDAYVQLKVSKRSRAAAQVSVDGREVQVLSPGQFLQVAMSPYPIPCVNRASTGRRRRRSDPPLMDETTAATKDSGGKIRVEDKVAATGTPCIPLSHSDRGEDDWVGDINTLLRFNASFSGRGLLGGNGAFEDQDE